VSEHRKLSTFEQALMEAEHAARAALLSHDIDVTGLVLNVTFSTPEGAWAIASKVPDPAPEFLAASLYQSAQEAGLTVSDMW
jgi:hypothetical protein